MPWSPELLRVLIVEDQEATRGLVKKMLRELRVQQVFEAKNGREGLDHLSHAPNMINMVICDWNMPEMTGAELLRQVRSVMHEVPFIMLTGRADEDSITEARDAGVTGYLLKPFARNQLEAKMRGVLSKQGRTA
jgi:CheY-like chemotaxis protein